MELNLIHFFSCLPVLVLRVFPSLVRAFGPRAEENDIKVPVAHIT